MKNQEVLNKIKDTGWNFYPVPRGLKNHDPKPGDKFGILAAPNEFTQNALDQRRKDSKNVIVNIREQKCYRDELLKHDYISEEFLTFMDRMDRCKLDSDDISNNEIVDCLILEDFNTTGLTGDASYFNSILSDGRRNGIHIFNNQVGNMGKLNDAHLGGSEGEGRSTFCIASEISTFFYYSVNENNEECIFGICYSGIFNDEKGEKEYPSIISYGDIVYDDQSNWCVPITDKEKINKFKKTFNINRTDNQPGLSVVIPYKDNQIKIKAITKNIIENYRIPILRDQIQLNFNKVSIDNENIKDYYFKNIIDYNNKSELRAVNQYFDFISNTLNTASFKNYEIKINYSNVTNIRKDVHEEYDHIIRDYRRNKIICFRIPFSVVKKQKNKSKNDTRITEDKNTYFEVFCQKPITPHGTSLKLCDVVRGYMPLIGMRENMSDFMFTNVSDEEAMLFVKTGEIANHTKIKFRHPKYRENYSETYVQPAKFFNMHFRYIAKFLNDHDEEYDDTTTNDLIADFEDADGISGTGGENEEITKPSSMKDLPEIPQMLHRYKTNIIKSGWCVKGVEYSRDEVESRINQSREFIEAAENKLDDKEQLDLEDIQKINKFVVSAKRRIEQYNLFLDDNINLFPIKIVVQFGFEDGSKSPEKSYSRNDFDLADSGIFKYKEEGMVRLSKLPSDNRLELEATGSDFYFEITGFGSESERQIGVHHIFREVEK